MDSLLLKDLAIPAATLLTSIVAALASTWAVNRKTRQDATQGIHDAEANFRQDLMQQVIRMEVKITNLEQLERQCEKDKIELLSLIRNLESQLHMIEKRRGTWREERGQ